MPGMPQAIALLRAESLRSELACTPIAYGGEEIAMTASFGIATYSRDGRTVDELIAAADRAMYAAKADGRNCVHLS